MPCLGPVPFFPDAARLPAEDSLALDHAIAGDGPFVIAVPRLPRIANFDDLDPLRAEPNVSVRDRRAGPAIAAKREPHSSPRQQGDARRSCGAAQGRLGHRHPRPSSRRQAGARPLRRLPDAGPTRSPIRMASKATPGASQGLGLLDVETTHGRGQAVAGRAGHPCCLRRRRSPAITCIWASPPGRIATAPSPARHDAPRARCPPTAWSSAPTFMACSPPTRFAAPSLAGRADPTA